jgi:Type II secretion system (T2SS), protein E, N-terminal domain
MMNETETLDPNLKQLLDRMVAAKQLASTDAATLARQCRPGAKAVVQSEEDVLRWLAKEYDVVFATLDNIEPDRELLSLFPARVLLKEELLPLQRTNGTVPRRDWILSRR